MKKLWQRLPELSRKWKTVRNIAFAVRVSYIFPLITLLSIILDTFLSEKN